MERPPPRRREDEGDEPAKAAADAGRDAADATTRRAASGAAVPDGIDPSPSGQGIWQQIDDFLDELADAHRGQMEDVVRYLWKSGNFEREIHDSVKAIGGLFQKWSFEIMFLLRMRGTMRFNQLKEELASVGPDSIGKKVKDLAGVGSRTLSQRLKELELHGVIRREVFPEVPVRVEYSLTPKGLRFGDLMMPVIAHLRLWDAQGRAS